PPQLPPRAPHPGSQELGAGGPGQAGQARENLGAIGFSMSLISFIFYFLLISFVVALVTSLIRLREPARILSEASRFFLTIVVCIPFSPTLFFIREWICIRPLL